MEKGADADACVDASAAAGSVHRACGMRFSPARPAVGRFDARFLRRHLGWSHSAVDFSLLRAFIDIRGCTPP
jgi:hypothetical protein